MKKLSLNDLKAKSDKVVTNDVMSKITGGIKNMCHLALARA